MTLAVLISLETMETCRNFKPSGSHINFAQQSYYSYSHKPNGSYILVKPALVVRFVSVRYHYHYFKTFWELSQLTCINIYIFFFFLHSYRTSWYYQSLLFTNECISDCLKNNIKIYVNLLKPTGYVMHQQFNIQQLYALPTLHLCVLYLSENKQRLMPLTS